VIASGGLNNLVDLKAIKATGRIAGAVLGKALYEGTIDLTDALQAISEATR
jgi:phosphoribosylformimino-5-aminoimidazole carboxamide ribotide isomerase